MTMDIQTVKLDLIQWLAGLQDPAKVSKILAVRSEIEDEENKTGLKPMTKEELIARSIASFKDYENGDVIDIEELEKEYL